MEEMVEVQKTGDLSSEEFYPYFRTRSGRDDWINLSHGKSVKIPESVFRKMENIELVSVQKEKKPIGRPKKEEKEFDDESSLS